jgi:acyl-CoA hydrolase
MKAKTPTESETIKTEVVFPNDTNPMGILQGGRMVQWMDIAAAVCAQKHAAKIAVTVSIDNVSFNRSARIGDIITIRAVITRAFSTSMEIFVSAHAKNVISQESNLINEAYFTFVALDDHARPTAVPTVTAVSKEEKQRYRDALLRKQKARQ